MKTTKEDDDDDTGMIWITKECLSHAHNSTISWYPGGIQRHLDSSFKIN